LLGFVGGGACPNSFCEQHAKPPVHRVSSIALAQEDVSNCQKAGLPNYCRTCIMVASVFEPIVNLIIYTPQPKVPGKTASWLPA
jgi:hypothetical protein